MHSWNIHVVELNFFVISRFSGLVTLWPTPYLSQFEMEMLKRRFEEESRARATADSRILEVSFITCVYTMDGKTSRFDWSRGVYDYS